MLVLALIVSVSLAAPAYACACGAYIPNGDAYVVDEKALVRWDGSTEDIVMAMGVQGSSDKAGWIMPVPSEAEVALAEPTVFDELRRLTRPRTEYRDSWWPSFDWLRGDRYGGGAPGGADGGVQVRGQQRLGPFDVTRLGADDPKALADWLGKEGFDKPATLDEGLAPYVQEGWEIVAIKLAPAEGDELTGELQPLRLTFASDEPVYPMRLSRNAERQQTVQLYLLADHRMDPRTAASQTYDPELRFAGRVEASVDTESLKPYLGDGMFLTRWDNLIVEPKSIASDYTFAAADADTAYQEVTVLTRDRGAITSAVLLLLLLAAAIVIVFVVVRRTRGRMTS